MLGSPEEPLGGMHAPVLAPSRQDQRAHLSTAQNEGRKNLTETDSSPNILERLLAKGVVVTAGTKEAVMACVRNRLLSPSVRVAA